MEQAQFRKRFMEKLCNPHYNFVTVEIGMPQGFRTRKVRDGCHILGEKGTDALNLADNPNARVRLHPLSFQSRLQTVGPAYMDTIYHVTCRDKNIIALETELLGAAALNITAILAVTGDGIRKGPEPAKAVFEGNSLKLIEIIKSMNKGKLLGGDVLSEPTDLLVGVAYNPNARNIDRETERLLKKIEAGADFAETQPVHSKEAFDRCIDALARYGISQEKFPVIFGMMPIVSRKNGEFLNKNFSGISVPEEILEAFDGVESIEEREQISYAQSIDLATHFARDGTNNYYIICPFSRYKLVAQIVEFVKFGYSQITFKGETIVNRDFARTPRAIGANEAKKENRKLKSVK